MWFKPQRCSVCSSSHTGIVLVLLTVTHMGGFLSVSWGYYRHHKPCAYCECTDIDVTSASWSNIVLAVSLLTIFMVWITDNSIVLSGCESKQNDEGWDRQGQYFFYHMLNHTRLPPHHTSETMMSSARWWGTKRKTGGGGEQGEDEGANIVC